MQWAVPACAKSRGTIQVPHHELRKRTNIKIDKCDHELDAQDLTGTARGHVFTKM